jgi:hypothetical protein
MQTTSAYTIVPDLCYDSLMVDNDIIQCGKGSTVELNSIYGESNVDNLNNFESDATVQQ